MPPRELPRVARTITIEDVDRGVKRWFERVLDLHVETPQGDRRRVPVKFTSGERWVASRDREGIRDRDGRLILPVIQIRRADLDPTQGSSALGANVPKLQIARLVAEKTSLLANLDSSRPISNRRLRDSAVYDVWTIPFPASTVAHYKVRVQVQYQTHLNEFVQKMLNSLEFFDVPSFVVSLSGEERNVGIPTGDGSKELEPEPHALYEDRPPLDDYYVVGYLEDSLSVGGNAEEFTDQERILQLEFGFRVPAVLILDPPGEMPAVQRTRTAFGIQIGDETTHFVDDPAVADKIFGPK